MINKKQKIKNLMLMELDEVEEISELLLQRIEKRAQELQNIEKRLDRKISIMKKVLKEVENRDKLDNTISDSRITEVQRLSLNGCKREEIAALLDMPMGEVDLILNLQSQFSQNSHLQRFT